MHLPQEVLTAVPLSLQLTAYHDLATCVEVQWGYVAETHLALHDEVIDGRQVVRRRRVRHRLLLEGRGDQRRGQRRCRCRRCVVVLLRMLPRAGLCVFPHLRMPL